MLLQMACKNGPTDYQTRMAILKSEFPKIPVNYIEKMQAEKIHLYPSYMALVDAQAMGNPPYPTASWRPVRSVDFITIAAKYGIATMRLEDELAAAKKARNKLDVQRRKEAAQRREEEANIEHSKAAGAVAEWYFDPTFSFPMTSS